MQDLQISELLVEEAKAIISKKTEKKKGRKKKAKKAQETNDLPEEEVEDYSEESSKVKSPIQHWVRWVQSLRDQSVNFLEGETSGSVKRIYTAEYTDSEVGPVVSSIKAAKASENHVQGQIYKSLDFRKALTEVFLFDTGASVSIIGQYNQSQG